MNSNLLERYIAHLNSILDNYNEYVSPNRTKKITEQEGYYLLTRSREAIERIGGKKSHYTKQCEEILSQESNVLYKVDLLIGILQALRDDIRTGFLVSFSELIRGEVFLSYLDMAEYLCQQEYKDAAAIIAGSTLEAYLKQLCKKNNIDLVYLKGDGSVHPKKASTLNEDLGKFAKDSYSQFDQKSVTAWLDLRNQAAHGQYDKYSIQQVTQFVEWLKDFTSRHLA